MNILALETATDACSVALLTAVGLWSRHEVAPRQHTDLLLGMIDAVLADAAVTRNNIDGVAFGHGPGSFTGVRIAASVAQGIAAARNLPVAPVSSLRALAAGAIVADEGGRVLVALDARRAEIYFAAYEFDADNVDSRAHCQDCVIAPEDVRIPDGVSWLRAGNGWDAYASRLPAAVQALPAATVTFPDARHIASLGAAEFAAGRGVSAAAAIPRYLRGAVG